MGFRVAVILPAILILSSIAYAPGLTGGFAFDDYSTILQNPFVIDAEANIDSLADAAWSGGVAGKLRRPIPMLTFAFNAITSGSAPFSYKVTNLLIHLINGVLLFFLLKVLCKRVHHGFLAAQAKVDPSLVALAITSIWLLHPINLTTVLYVVQRMTSIATLFSLLALLAYCYGRERQIAGRSAAFLIYFITPLFITLAVFSKENAVLVPALIALIECCFYRFAANSAKHRQLLISAYVLFSGTVLLIFAYFVWTNPGWLAERYEYRSFSVTDRLMTESRVLWIYISMILVPRLPQFALYHDDIFLSQSVFEPLSTLFSLSALFLALVVAVLAFKKRPIVTFGILWFLVGHSLESSVIPLDIAHEHRNYLPSVGIFFLCFACLAAWAEKHDAVRKNFVFITTVPAFILASLTLLRAMAWSDPVTLANTEAQNHPDSFRSVYAAARVQVEFFRMRGNPQDKKLAMERLEKAAQLDKENALPFIALIQLSDGSDDESTRRWSEEIRQRLQFELTKMPEASALGGLVSCHRQNTQCSVPLKSVAEFYYAALANEYLRPAVKAKLLSDFALLNVNSLGDFPLALGVAREAVALKPNYSTYRELLIRLLVLDERLDEAQRELSELASRRYWEDRIKVSPEKIIDLQQSIEQALTRRGQNNAAS